MPPKKRSQGPTAPDPLMHRSSRRSQQLRFPGRRKVVRTYGGRNRVQPPKQQTLTQIGYVIPPASNLQDLNLDEERSDQHNVGGAFKVGDDIAKRRKTCQSSPVGPLNPFSPLPTMTNAISLELSVRRDEDDADSELGVAVIQDSDDEYEANSPQTKSLTEARQETPDARSVSLEPQTPIQYQQRTEVTSDTLTPKTRYAEIPSSQPTPFTPLLLDRYYSPLGQARSSSMQVKKTDKAMDITDGDAAMTSQDIPRPVVGAGSPFQRRAQESSQVIPDSYSITDSVNPVANRPGSSNSTERQKRRPLRRFLSVEFTDRSYHQYSTLLEEAPPKKAVKQTNKFLATEEIPDTDEEDDLCSLDSASPGFPKTSQLVTESMDKKESDIACLMYLSDSELGNTPTPLSAMKRCNVYRSPPQRRKKSNSYASRRSPPSSGCQNSGVGTVANLSAQMFKAQAVAAESASAGECKTQKAGNKSASFAPSHTFPPKHRGEAADRRNRRCQVESTQPNQTQALESQRVPLDVIRLFGPQTDRSDIIISIHPEHVQKIVDGTKDHEFRNYKIPQTVTRFWIYVTRPICELQYMAIVDAGFRQAGEIDSSSGMGNADFNAGHMAAKFAYKLRQVYQLNNPVSLDVMKKNGWVDGPPQRYAYVPPAVVGALLANLRCALFEEEGDDHADGDTGIKIAEDWQSVSQEIEAQLLSDVPGIQLEQNWRLASCTLNDAKRISPTCPADSINSGTTHAQVSTTLSCEDGYSAASFGTCALGAYSGIGGIRPSQATTASSTSQDLTDANNLAGVRLETQSSSQPPWTGASVVRPDLESGTAGVSLMADERKIGSGASKAQGEESQLEMSIPGLDPLLASQQAWHQCWRRKRQQRQQMPQPTRGRPPRSLISSSADSTQIALPDSLYEEVRQAPPAVILDSEDSEDEH